VSSPFDLPVLLDQELLAEDPGGTGEEANGRIGVGDALLGGLAAALDSPLKLKGVLSMIARRVVHEVGSDHCSVFLLDGRALYPAVAVSRRPSENLGEAFRSMAPIEVDPERWALFGGAPVVIEDATASPLIPTAWIERFC